MTRSWIKTFVTITDGFYNLTAVKQFGLLFTFSLSVALICGATFWVAGQENHTNSSLRDESANPTISSNHAGVTKSSTGYEIFDKSQIGSSQFIETARYWHALEMELAHTISTFDQVKTARVHLAIPKSSVFVDHHNKATASVLIELFNDQVFMASQVNAVKKLVASSVPQLISSDVTVVDNEGHLLPYDYQPEHHQPVLDSAIITTFKPSTIEQPWFIILVKSALIGMIAFLLLVISRSILQLGTNANSRVKPNRVTPRMNSDYSDEQTYLGDTLHQTQPLGQWRQVNKLAADDPAYIANVIKKWVGED